MKYFDGAYLEDFSAVCLLEALQWIELDNFE